jgi:glucose-6-phosphate dehydrogenase assembly protein OpcA
MEKTVSSAFISAETIQKQLHELWVCLGQQKSAVLRACAMTLIVVDRGQEEGTGEIYDILAALMRNHPSRAIVLHLTPSTQEAIQARVFAQCRLPLGQSRQICCEQIEITSDVSRLPEAVTIVLGSMAPDLPVVLWCRSFDLLDVTGFRDLANVVDKIITDSGRHSEPQIAFRRLLTLRRGQGVVADLAWTRLTPWREAVAQVFAMRACATSSPHISQVRIWHGGPKASTAAYYLAAWLINCLGWKPGESGELAMLPIEIAAPGEVMGLEAVSPEMTITVRQQSISELNIRVNGVQYHVRLPASPHAEALSEEMSILGADLVYDRSLERVVELLRP